jgi:hypothetical protein
VLDRSFFSSIIYILYEGGSLSPPVVTTGLPDTSWAATFQGGIMAKKTAKGGAKKKGGKKR